MNDNSPNAWSDFNDAESQQSGFNLIPKGELVPVLMTLKPGGHYDASQGWSDGYPTLSSKTGAVYLAAEFVITGGEFAKRKMWSNIGLYSPKGPTWTQMGRTFVRAALNSARNVLPQDNSPQAAASRRIQGFVELDGLEFVVRVDIEKDERGDDRNVVKIAVEPDHPQYAQIMGVPSRTVPASGSSAAAAGSSSAVPPQHSGKAASVAQRPVLAGKPAWAQ
ncbi:MAG: hypothetical protein KBF66_03180 [Rhodoferax sp.]|uniref:hypothetical protein n=1 Tax=Rhodoferax sp. TaxID=50421 RepID=UPI001B561486|nr:hypothetical protein [Rhodoferax sp.]MBP9904534.1 hypothetical protein [Rhodoferax sp.]